MPAQCWTGRSELGWWMNRSVRRLCIALNALAEASAIADTRPAARIRAQESNALTERAVTTPMAISMMTDFSSTDALNQFSMKAPNFLNFIKLKW